MAEGVNVFFCMGDKFIIQWFHNARAVIIKVRHLLSCKVFLFCINLLKKGKIILLSDGS